MTGKCELEFKQSGQTLSLKGKKKKRPIHLFWLCHEHNQFHVYGGKLTLDSGVLPEDSLEYH